MILFAYRITICVLIAFMLHEIIGHVVSDTPISPGWASFALFSCCYFLWERLEISIKLQKIIEANRAKNG